MGFSNPVTPNAVLSVLAFINDVPNISQNVFTVTAGPQAVVFNAGPDTLMFPTEGAASTPVTTPVTLASITESLPFPSDSLSSGVFVVH